MRKLLIERSHTMKKNTMKKIYALITGMVLLLCGACAAQPKTSVFDTLSGMEWSFSSGAGGWSTDLQIRADGSFSGTYHDSEMGECADEYPDGTVYVCSFTGRMSLVKQVDEKTWKIRVDKLEKEETKEEINDGIRYVPSEPYGISEGDTMVLYSPGTPVSIFTEDMLFWTHVQEQKDTPVELDVWFLSSERNESGFVGYPQTAAMNPWEDMTEKQLTAAAGVSFGVPEGAENVIYRYLRSDGLAEMQFTWMGGEFCARIQPMTLKKNELYDISGMYYEWETDYPVEIGHCFGTLSKPVQDGEKMVARCLWYDMVPGLMYSLSVTDADIDGLDLTALAEQVYIPMQGND